MWCDIQWSFSLPTNQLDFPKKMMLTSEAKLRSGFVLKDVKNWNKIWNVFVLFLALFYFRLTLEYIDYL